MTGRFLPLPLSCALLVAACATAKDPAGDPIDAAEVEPIDAAEVEPIDAAEVPSDGPPGCVPTTEVCDGQDNDCDNQSDENNPGGGGTCSTGMVGACAAGTSTCMGGDIVCVQNVQPTTELCNGVDDDCDAATADGSAEAWFGQVCDGTDLDACTEGTMACNGSGQVCSDATGDSNVISDSGFEAGTTGWTTQFSTNFGSPLCTVADCGTGQGTGPRGGTVWNWLGGTAAAETAYVSQSKVIPVGTATLTFYLEIPACGTGGTAETFSVRIDGNNVYTANNSDPTCGVVGYQLKSVDVSAYANGGAHTIEFRGDFNTGQTTATNFMVDDVRLVSCP